MADEVTADAEPVLDAVELLCAHESWRHPAEGPVDERAVGGPTVGSTLAAVRGALG